MLAEHAAGPSAAARCVRFCADQEAVLLVTLDGQRPLVELDGDVRVFNRARLAQMRRSFVTLLHGALKQPACWVRSMPLLSRQEQRLMPRWNDTAVTVPAAPGGAGLHHCIEQQVDRTPDAIAVMLDGESMSYAELDRCANA